MGKKISLVFGKGDELADIARCGRRTDGPTLHICRKALLMKMLNLLELCKYIQNKPNNF